MEYKDSLTFEGYIFDYRLGYVRDDCELMGFDVYGGDDAPKGCIVALGGYTTPEQAQSGKSWAQCLYEQHNGEYRILSGCTDGYCSAQILTMFIREVILLKPKLVVCLSGFYNIAYKLGLVQNKSDAEFLSAHPFATPGHLHFYRKITSRFGLGNDEVFYGLENRLPAWELWLRQMAEIKCLCDEFELGFKTCLQPCVFSGNYKYSEREAAYLREQYSINDSEINDFHAGFQREYSELICGSAVLDYITDLSHVFDGCSDVYADALHVRDEHLPKLAEEICI